MYPNISGLDIKYLGQGRSDNIVFAPWRAGYNILVHDVAASHSTVLG